MGATLAAGVRALEGGSQASLYEPAKEISEVAALERADNIAVSRSMIDCDMENPGLSTPLGWSNGFAKRSGGANFPEFVYAGFEEEAAVGHGQKKKRLDEVDREVVFEAQGQVDWRIEI
jgi:hypothetical protein